MDGCTVLKLSKNFSQDMKIKFVYNIYTTHWFLNLFCCYFRERDGGVLVSSWCTS